MSSKEPIQPLSKMNHNIKTPIWSLKKYRKIRENKTKTNDCGGMNYNSIKILQCC